MGKVLRASKAGFPCQRNLWYAVNDAVNEKGEYELTDEDKRRQRIFDVGTCLEPLIVEWLRRDGWEVEYNPGSQEAELKVEVPLRGGSLVGHPDCVISKGSVKNALVDIKTMNDRAFSYWKREGTQKAKPQYVTQLYVYALGLKASGREVSQLGIVGVNKNNSEMHIDFFPFDEISANAVTVKAEELFRMEKAPELNSPSESWACSYCEYAEICELNKKPSAVEVKDEPLTTTKDETVIGAMRVLKESRDMSHEAKKMEEWARVILDEKVRDKGLSGIQGGGLEFRITPKNSSKFDSKRFKEEHPELVREYTTAGVSLTYNIKALK